MSSLVLVFSSEYTADSRLEIESGVVVDRQLGILCVEFVQCVDIELASALLGQRNQTLESIRIGVVVIPVVGIVIPPGCRDIPFASGMSVQTVLSIIKRLSRGNRTELPS
jgi:hypothetical protein